MLRASSISCLVVSKKAPLGPADEFSEVEILLQEDNTDLGCLSRLSQIHRQWNVSPSCDRAPLSPGPQQIYGQGEIFFLIFSSLILFILLFLLIIILSFSFVFSHFSYSANCNSIPPISDLLHFYTRNSFYLISIPLPA